MAAKCENCKKGGEWGHMVSHAKNRLNRLFKPNLQSLKVLSGDAVLKVTLCTSCIKRLKKDGRIGRFSVPVAASVLSAMKLPNIPAKSKAVKEENAKEAMRIEEIVGKKN